ncbi:MAG: AAA family ATPase [Acutalibacteraceae bacterium]
MKIQINNIGKISKADINIDGITVIAGENNTGKSTIGKALFATFESLFGYSDYIELQKAKYIEQILKSQSRILDKHLKELAGVQLGKYSSIIKSLVHYRNQYIAASSENDVINITTQFCHEHLERYNISIADVLDKHSIIQWINAVSAEISKIFSTKDESVGNKKITRTFSGVFNDQIIRIPNDGNCIDEADIQLTIKNKINSLHFSREKEDTCFDNNQMVEIVHRPVFIENSRVVNVLSNCPDNMDEIDWIKILCRPNGVPFYFSKAKKEAIDNSDNNEVNDYVLLNLEKQLKSIEDKLYSVIKGKFVKVDSELQFMMEGYSKPFKLSNLSTGLKAFALFQRIIELGVLGEKDILILDEPEINLHPEWQLIYAELIIIMQQQLDLTVLITTHSPYFLEAIEVYTKKYGINNKCHYYLAEEVDNNIQFNDVTDNREPIYKKLFVPLQKLENIAYNGEVVE